MVWNHRILRRHYPDAAKGAQWSYGIYEVYYHDDGTVNLITEEPVSPYGNTRDELISDFTQMLGAFLKPVLNYEDF